MATLDEGNVECEPSPMNGEISLRQGPDDDADRRTKGSARVGILLGLK